MGRSKVFNPSGGNKRVCTYEVLAPAPAKLKALCLGPWPVENPFKEGLNFFKMSVKIKRKRDCEYQLRGRAQLVPVTPAAEETCFLHLFNRSPDYK